MFDQAKLAIVAYAEVNSDGSSTQTNSGVKTSKLGTGTYAIDLPTGVDNAQAMAQFSDRDLIFVQPLNAAFPVSVTAVNDATNIPPGTIPALAGSRKIVLTGTGATTAVDCAFSVLILRTVTPPALGGPA
jgi:hypothetical protein